MTSQLARDLAAIAHQHYVTPSTTDQGPSEALAGRMQERLNRARKNKLPPMPPVNPARPLDDDKPNGYLESLDDWCRNNADAVTWFLENEAELRKAVET